MSMRRVAFMISAWLMALTRSLRLQLNLPMWKAMLLYPFCLHSPYPPKKESETLFRLLTMFFAICFHWVCFCIHMHGQRSMGLFGWPNTYSTHSPRHQHDISKIWNLGLTHATSSYFHCWCSDWTLGKSTNIALGNLCHVVWAQAPEGEHQQKLIAAESFLDSFFKWGKQPQALLGIFDSRSLHKLWEWECVQWARNCWDIVHEA